MQDRINIKAARDVELCSKVIISEEPYIVETECSHGKGKSLITRVYKRGAIISRHREDLGDDAATMPPGKLEELMKNIHNSAIDRLKKENLKVSMGPSVYLDNANVLLRRKQYKNALALIREGVKAYPDNALLLSYCGYWTAKYENKYDKGIADCKEAIQVISRKVPYDLEFVYPMFFINLGRAYLAANDRKNAVETFNRLMSSNPESADVLNELKNHGLIRRKPVIPFLKRSNLINKYLGILRHKVAKSQP
jgi:tetratricopeptide (TPR) repeat protein